MVKVLLGLEVKSCLLKAARIVLVEAGVIQVLTYYRSEQALARTGNNAVVVVAIYHFSKGFLDVWISFMMAPGECRGL
jgi:hypothetical protein